MAPTALADVLPDRIVSKAAQPADEPHVHGGEDLTPMQAISHGDVSLQGYPKFQSLAEKREWQLEHMAAAFRYIAREGLCEGISGHISVRDPENEGAFWTNPLGVHFGMMKKSDMILLDYEGNVIGGNRSRPANRAGFLIHSAIHKARSDVHAACHFHGVHGRAWSVFGRPLDMLTQDSCKLYKNHSVYNAYGGIVFGEEEGHRIAKALGDGKLCILRNHGLLTVGETVDEACFLFGLGERLCKIQLLAEAAANQGMPKILISDDEAAYNYKMEADPQICFEEHQPYYQYELAVGPELKN